MASKAETLALIKRRIATIAHTLQNREAAKALLLTKYPNLKFYR